MFKIKNHCGNRGTKKGFTLTELIVSIAFAALIFGTATYAWWASNETFQSTDKTSKAYSQARSLESLLQDAASSTSHLIFSDAPISYPSGQKYFQFYFEDYSNSSGPYMAAYHVGASPQAIQFNAIDHMEGSVKVIGRRCILNYKIQCTDEKGPFYIKGGVVLNNIDQATFSADNPGTPATKVMNFQIDTYIDSD